MNTKLCVIAAAVLLLASGGAYTAYYYFDAEAVAETSQVRAPLPAAEDIYHVLADGGFLWLNDEPDNRFEGITALITLIVEGQGYTCDEPVKLTGHGPTPRGRYGQLMCRRADGDEITYRVELWTDKDTFSVRPW